MKGPSFGMEGISLLCRVAPSSPKFLLLFYSNPCVRERTVCLVPNSAPVSDYNISSTGMDDKVQCTSITGFTNSNGNNVVVVVALYLLGT